GQAQRTARHFQQQQQADDGGGDVQAGGLARTGGQLFIEQEQVGAAEGGDDGQYPVVPGHAIARRALARGIGQVAQEHGDAQVQRAGLGVVENAPVQGEGQRRGIPELEQRPQQRAQRERGAS